MVKEAQVVPRSFKRAMLVIMDSVGIGAMPDCASYNDPATVATLQNIASGVGGLSMPRLERMGLGLLGSFAGIRALAPQNGCVLRAAPKSRGKDTTTGHWELAGHVTKDPFCTFAEGFPAELIASFVAGGLLPGILANHPGSGTEIIKQYGMEHLASGKPIVYTSADSVFQIACHEEAFGLERLYKLCEQARKLCDQYRIGRVIARPFTGHDAASFVRTSNRKDYSIAIPGKILFEYLRERSLPVHTIGKVASIYNYQGITTNVKSVSNRDGMAKLLNALDQYEEGLIVINFLDFDQEYGHRRNVRGYAAALEEFDTLFGAALDRMHRDDFLVVTADHGNDPTAPGTDHTREYVPVLIHAPVVGQGRRLDDFQGFDCVGGTIFHALTGETPPFGASLLSAI